ncbi:mitochondrial transcription rescue factor 1-like [Anopheles albimanus]|uniref:mitochondrial transcription rescue factor 1-like n=1 Tax=Anopheles albimanus TaxID=7167 RepID=UPI0016415081|nr:mitochondrial transcription rescue factor 1-like [Anopheles albimanus]
MSLLVRSFRSSNVFHILKRTFQCPLADSQRRCYESLNNQAGVSAITLHSVGSLYNHQPQCGKSTNKASGRRGQPKNSSIDDEEDAEDVENDTTAYDDLIGDKHSRLMKVTVNSLRADVLLKAGLGIARNKVEGLFYESKIRVNGKKLLKKSSQLEQEDEIDVIRGLSPNNPDYLIVSRVEILSVEPRAENLVVTLRRQNSLVIENYPES